LLHKTFCILKVSSPVVISGNIMQLLGDSV
jgi:hypothetical protein